MIARQSAANSGNEGSLRDALPSSRSRANLDRLSWDNLRLFLAVAEAGSFRSAAQLAAVSINTIRTKVERLERQIGAPLFRRSVEGVALTQNGQELLQIAREMRALGRSADRVREGSQALRSERVRISASDEIGTFWLLPSLVDLQIAHPSTGIELDCESRAAEVLFRDVDIALQLDPPTSPELMSERIATLHFMPFASQAYLDAHGTPTSVAEAAEHRLVWQRSDVLPADLPLMFQDEAARDTMVAIQTNTSTAHYLAVVKGGGIGFLPTYARTLTPILCPVDIGLTVRRDVYLVHHGDAVTSGAVATTLDWLRAAFDNVTNPWFADQFIHPSSFDTIGADNVVANLFDEVVSQR